MERLPDEILGIILSMVEDVWLNAGRLATVNRKFHRVIVNNPYLLFKHISYCYLPQSFKKLVGLSRFCGECVRSLKLATSSDVFPTLTERSNLQKSLKRLVNLEVLDVGEFKRGSDLDFLSIFVHMPHLRELSLVLGAVQPPQPIGSMAMAPLVCSDQYRQVLSLLAPKISSFKIKVFVAVGFVEKVMDQLQSLALCLTQLEVCYEYPDRDGSLCTNYGSWVQTGTRDCLRPLANFTQLTSLTIGLPYIMEKAVLLEVLDQCRGITSLNVALVCRAQGTNMPIEAPFFDAFKRVPHLLTSLNLVHWYTFVRDSVLIDVARSFPSLKVFCFSPCYLRLSHAARAVESSGEESTLAQLATNCPKLERVCISKNNSPAPFHFRPEANKRLRSQFADRARSRAVPHDLMLFGSLTWLGQLAHLHSLCLCDVSLVEPRAILKIATACPQLKALQLAHIDSKPSLFIPFLPATLRALPNLTALQVYDADMQLGDDLCKAALTSNALTSLSLICHTNAKKSALMALLANSPKTLKYVHFGCVGVMKDHRPLTWELHSAQRWRDCCKVYVTFLTWPAGSYTTLTRGHL